MTEHDQTLLYCDGTIWIVTKPTGQLVYDFDFRACFPCRTPWTRPSDIEVIARMGAFNDYRHCYDDFSEEGIRLVNSPEQYLRASELSGWYPLIEDITPRSRWYESPPSITEVEQDFDFPVFVKGIRQTSRHRQSLSIIRSRQQFLDAMTAFRSDDILQWQPVVVRELVPLRPIGESSVGSIPSSFEFRTFWWRGECVGSGRYWLEGGNYDWNAAERIEGINVAKKAAVRVDVPFLVVDIALTLEGRWIVIECNDGQESGYAGVSAIGLWQNILNNEKERLFGH